MLPSANQASSLSNSTPSILVVIHLMTVSLFLLLAAQAARTSFECASRAPHLTKARLAHIHATQASGYVEHMLQRAPGGGGGPPGGGGAAAGVPDNHETLPT
eukprot:3759445-Amphidinium_carterae.1